MRKLTVIPLLFLAACTIEKQDGDYRTTLAPIFGQRWEETQRGKTPGGERVCTVSAGEMDVTLRGHGGRAVPQVAVNYKLSSGDSYKIIMRSQNYETPSGAFNARESQAIIAQMMDARVIYTEVSRRVISYRGSQWKRWANKIPMEGFAAEYRSCEKYVAAKK